MASQGLEPSSACLEASVLTGKHSLAHPRGCLLDCQPSLPSPCLCLPVKVILDKYYFLCGQPLHFIPRRQVCDGQQDCASGEDEQHCVKNFPDESPVAGESRGWRDEGSRHSRKAAQVPLGPLLSICLLACQSPSPLEGF